MKSTLIFLFLCYAANLQAQVSAEFGPGGGDRQGSLIIYGSQNLQSRIPYDKIKGIPYWRIDFMPALLYAPGNKLYGKFLASVNLATREVEYINNKHQIVAAYPDELAKVVFVDPNDSSKIISIFRNDIAEVNLHFIKRNKRYYVQEMNQGPVKLLKVTDREMRVGDSAFRTLKSYYFVDVEDYFIQHQTTIEKLKKLSENEVMQYLPQPPAIDAWIADNKIRYNREEDVLRLLEYYNQATVKKK